MVQHPHQRGLTFPRAGKPFGKLYLEVREKGLIDCVCRACSAKIDALKGIEAQGLPLCNERNGHPSLEKYLAQGYRVITFRPGETLSGLKISVR